MRKLLKRFVLPLCVLFSLYGQALKPSAPAPPISNEAKLTLQLIAKDEEPIREALDKIAQAALMDTSARRNAVIISECKRIGANASATIMVDGKAVPECGLDFKSGLIIDHRPAPKADPDSGKVK